MAGDNLSVLVVKFEIKELSQVSEVSTVLCGSAKNSADCISTKRETVLGNSCDMGPSV